MSRAERAREAARRLADDDMNDASYVSKTAWEVGDEVDRLAGMRLDRDEAAEAVAAYDDRLAEEHCYRALA